MDSEPKKPEPFFHEDFHAAIRLAPEAIRLVTAVVVTGGVFFSCWLYSIDAWGWFLGLAFGWLPSGIIAFGAYRIAYYLWWVAVGGAAIIGLSILFN